MYDGVQIKGLRKITLVAILIAMCLALTLLIQIPLPGGGYLNLSDTIILFTSAFVDPLSGGLVGAIGGGISDIISGYGLYAPFTVLAKFLEAIVCGLTLKMFHGHLRYIPFLLGGIVMASVYILPDCLLYFESVPLVFVNYGFNLIQGIVNGLLAATLYALIKERKMYL